MLSRDKYIIKILLQKGIPIRMHTRGSSMIPSIFPGDLANIRTLDHKPKKDGIYLYETDKHLILHRLIQTSITPNTYFIFKGDASITEDPPVNKNQIIGYLISTEKNHRSLLTRLKYYGKQLLFGQLRNR